MLNKFFLKYSRPLQTIGVVLFVIGIFFSAIFILMTISLAVGHSEPLDTENMLLTAIGAALGIGVSLWIRKNTIGRQ